MAGDLILVTGGAGFIGSHTVLELLERGFEVVVVDNLSNASKESLPRVEAITGKKVKAFHEVDITDKSALDKVFSTYSGQIKSVIHFAGAKAVGESVSLPLKYYHNNVTGTCILLEVMKAHNVKDIVFSSSATVYGAVEEVPKGGLTEDLPTGATNPYGRTKLFIEEIIKDMWVSDNSWNAIMLRYFNPVGAHPSGKIGEDPQGIPNNLCPFITQVAVGKRPKLTIFGNDYSTHDGTGVRDYIHVVDLAQGHLAAVKHLTSKPGYAIYNLGTGNGLSVLDMVNSMKKASGKEIAYEFAPRRPGDIGACFASPVKAEKELGWKAHLGVERMCEDAWRWQSTNPDGYRSAL